MESIPNYRVIISQVTLDMIITYKNSLLSKATRPGAYLNKLLIDEQIDIENISTEKFIELLLWTKKPLIFAESGISGNGDWNMEKLKILGDLNIAMDVIIFDNGIWSTHDKYFRQYDRPLNGSLLFMPGPLLNGVRSDLYEISDNHNNIDQNKYNHLIDRRLTPLLHYVNEDAKKQQVQGIVTIPGVGCGVFAGQFEGSMGERLNVALQSILAKHAKQLSNIICIYYDPFNECSNQEMRFENVKLSVRPSVKNPGKSLLSRPKDYEEQDDDFPNCKLFKIVAWDHVSFPGNDFFANSRSTDDGVSAAATNSMHIITGIEGKYQNGKYLPPKEYVDWQQVVHINQVKLKANLQNIHVYNL